MKKIVLILFSVLAVIQIKAQLVYDEWGDIIPVSLTEKYITEIEAYDVPSFVIPIMNNDSLCRKYNDGKTFNELGSEYTGGIDLETKPISLKENGICIKLKQGKLWRYAIEGESAGGIGFDLGFPKLPKGTYIAVFAPDTTCLIQPPKIYHSENLLERHKKMGIIGAVVGKKLIMEYYEPDTLKNKEDIVIKRISYDFVTFNNQNPSSYKTHDLKSGYYGDSGFISCQKDVECTTYGDYRNEAKSVVFIRARFRIDEDDNGVYETKFRKATGFFLNKVGGYNSYDTPLLVTAGHFYSFFKLGITPVDIDNYINEFLVVTRYQNIQCGTDDTAKRGIVLPGDFNRIALGSSYNQSGLPGYSPSEDYALLQAISNVSQLSSYDLVYGAWSKIHDFYNTSNSGYYCIHHPNGDVKKINKDNDIAYDISYNGFILKYDVGLTEEGSSGAPIFNSSRQIVGFHVGGASAKSCELIGQMSSVNGTFDHLYYEFNSILDPMGTGEATSSNPQPPSPSELPAHCRNCIRDEDETGIDCGGSCYPCGMQDVVTLKTPMDIPTTVKSRYEIFAEPDPGTLLALTGGSYSLETGINVYLKGGFVVEKGAEFYAGIDAELMSEPDRGCGNSCVQLYSLIEPDGDGYLDYLLMKQAFITSYDIMVIDYWNDVEYTANNLPVYANGIINVWDGSGGQSGSKRVVINYTDCNGYEHENSFYISYLSGEKSATLIDQNTETSVDDINKNANIIVYPNPFSNDVTINFAGGKFPLEYKIMDLTGKVFFHNKTSSSREVINLSGLAAGTYVINAKAGEFNLVEKLIKR
jgi:hypothetical protein